MNKSDFWTWFYLESLHTALKESALMPVSIMEPASWGGTELQPYDVYTDGKQIMKDRMTVASEDITQFMDLHSTFCAIYSNIQYAVKEQSRVYVYNSVFQLSQFFSQYTSLISAHRDRLNQQSFLFFPSCNSGTFTADGGSTPLKFNPYVTLEGSLSGMKSLTLAAESFAISSDSIHYGVRFPHDVYRENLLTTKKLLDRIKMPE